MESNVELNKHLLNKMLDLNEAGDNLDEIYRIGLETAVSPLNANRGCIFKWKVYFDHYTPNRYG